MRTWSVGFSEKFEVLCCTVVIGNVLRVSSVFLSSLAVGFTLVIFREDVGLFILALVGCEFVELLLPAVVDKICKD